MFPLCLIFTVSLPPTTRLPLTTLFIYVFSHFFLSLCLVLLFAHSFALQSWWQRLGCDPITGWLQQSPSADWFYNPHSGSQMGENQLAKKYRCESCHTDAHTHAPAYTLMHAAHIKTHTGFLPFSLNLYHTSWLHVIAFLLCTKISSTNVCACTCVYVRWDSSDWTTKRKRFIHSAEVLYLK